MEYKALRMMDWENIDEEDPRLIVPEEVLAAYPPHRDALFTLIRAQVTDEMLHFVAACDYGNEFEGHLAELKRLRAGVDLDRPIKWNPNEVLSLYRWSELSHNRDFRKPHDFHLTRAFCCCALLRAPDHVENRTLFEPHTLAPLIESCLALGRSYRLRLIQYLTWSVPQMSLWNDDVLFHAFALTYVVGLGTENDPRLLPILGDWLVHASRELVP